MNSLIAALVEEHRLVERGLDGLGVATPSGRIDALEFRQLATLNARHYLHEETFLREWQKHDPALVSKLRAQHDEALEIAARLDESLGAGETGDVLYLARRFLAIVQHNIIEEERDVFPLAERIFRTEEPER